MSGDDDEIGTVLGEDARGFEANSIDRCPGDYDCLKQTSQPEEKMM
jgi:hypothetical protein